MQTSHISTQDSCSVQIAFQSGELAVRHALCELKQALAPLGLCVDDMASVEIVMGEVLNNVVEHAYAKNTGGLIAMSCAPSDRKLWFCVEDEGVTLPDGALPGDTLPPIDGPVEALPEGGFGWYLVRSLTLDLEYRRVGCRNVLGFSIPFSG